MKAVTAVIAVATLFVVSDVAAGQDVVAGWEGGNTAGYAFIAPSAGFALTSSQSLVMKATASFLYYNSQAEGPTDVTAPGGGMAFGYRANTRRVNIALFGGLEQRRIHNGWERGASASGEVFLSTTPLTQISALGNFAQANRYTWLRLGTKRQLTNTSFTGARAISAGVEATAQGNRDVTTWELGGVLEHAWLRPGLSLQFRAGYSTSSFQTGPDQHKTYFGLGVYRRL
jgi:cellulose biosynthesis protein BcsS